MARQTIARAAAAGPPAAKPPQLRAALRIIGWDTTPGLVLYEREDSILPPPGGVAVSATSAR